MNYEAKIVLANLDTMQGVRISPYEFNELKKFVDEEQEIDCEGWIVVEEEKYERLKTILNGIRKV